MSLVTMPTPTQTEPAQPATTPDRRPYLFLITALVILADRLSNVDGWDASSNQTYQWRDFDANRWYALRLRVTGQRVQAWIDNEEDVNIPLGGPGLTLGAGRGE